MDRDFTAEARELLSRPPELREIPIFRADNALKVSALTRGKNHNLHYAILLSNHSTLYFTFPGMATRDVNGNFDSPIFQDDSYNGMKPLWQVFKEYFEQKWGFRISHIFFGEYDKRSEGQEFFTVKDEPGESHWIYIGKPDRDGFTINQLAPDRAKRYQAIIDGIRLERAKMIVKEKYELERSAEYREECIKKIVTEEFTSEQDRFTFGEKTFRYRQFNTQFKYTPEGLEEFREFYINVGIPYAEDERLKAEWKERSRWLKEIVSRDDKVGPLIRKSSASSFKLSPTDDGGCNVDIDITDDRTGQNFHLHVDSQVFDKIKSAVLLALDYVLLRKMQRRRADRTLQQLASGEISPLPR